MMSYEVSFPIQLRKQGWLLLGVAPLLLGVAPVPIAHSVRVSISAHMR